MKAEEIFALLNSLVMSAQQRKRMFCLEGSESHFLDDTLIGAPKRKLRATCVLMGAGL